MQCPGGLAGVLAIVTLAALSQAYDEELADLFDERPSLRVCIKSFYVLFLFSRSAW